MSDRPTPPDPDRPDQDQPADETAALPQSDAAATGPLPPHPPGAVPSTTGYGALPPQPGPGWPVAGVPSGSAAAPGGRPGGPRRWWDDATSTGGGRAALIAVAVLASLFLVAGVGLTAALVAGHDRWDRGEMGWTSGDRGPGNGNGNGKGDRGNGKDKDKENRGNGNGMMRGDGDGRPGPGGGRVNPVDPADPDVPGNNGRGMGMGRGAGALGDVLHGEYTTNVTGTPTVMVVQAGRVTAYTAGKTLTVESSDGFEAKYALDGSVETSRGGTALATGVQVRVVAAKEGMKVTRLVVG